METPDVGPVALLSVNLPPSAFDTARLLTADEITFIIHSVMFHPSLNRYLHFRKKILDEERKPGVQNIRPTMEITGRNIEILPYSLL
jgi:hypothetical protein